MPKEEIKSKIILEIKDKSLIQYYNYNDNITTEINETSLGPKYSEILNYYLDDLIDVIFPK